MTGHISVPTAHEAEDLMQVAAIAAMGFVWLVLTPLTWQVAGAAAIIAVLAGGLTLGRRRS